MDTHQELVDALQCIPWFQELSADHFNQIAEISHLTFVDEGQDLFKEGDKQDFLYVVVEGRIANELYIPGKGATRIYTVEPMDVVGWSSATPVVRQRLTNAKAVFPSRLVATDAKKLRKLCHEDHELGYIIMTRMANVAAARLMVTRLQFIDVFSHPTLEESE